MKAIAFAIICTVLLIGCSNEKKEITTEYIINENRTKENEQAGANSIAIDKRKVKKDSTIDPFSNLSQSQILTKLETDSSFTRYANIKIKHEESYKDKKIYFNRNNGFYWIGSLHKNDDTTKTIGILQVRKSSVDSTIILSTMVDRNIIAV